MSSFKEERKGKREDTECVRVWGMIESSFLFCDVLKSILHNPFRSIGINLNTYNWRQ